MSSLPRDFGVGNRPAAVSDEAAVPRIMLAERHVRGQAHFVARQPPVAVQLAPLGEKRRPGRLFLVDVPHGLHVGEEAADAVMGEEAADRLGPWRELPHGQPFTARGPVSCPVGDEDQEVPEHLPLVGGGEDPLVEVGDLEAGAFLGPRHVGVEADQDGPGTHITAEAEVIAGSGPHPVVGERCCRVLAEQPVSPRAVGDEPGQDG